MTIRVSQVVTCASPAELADVPVRVEIAVLHRVFGLRVVLEDGAGDAEEPAVVPAHEPLEGGVVIRGDALDQCAVGFGRLGRRFGRHLLFDPLDAERGSGTTPAAIVNSALHHRPELRAKRRRRSVDSEITFHGLD